MKRLAGEEHPSAHGFFHTIVVVGSALALGCGGESQSTRGAPQGVAGMGVDGSGGSAGNGAVPDCLPSQWTCSASYQCDSYELAATTDCTCDAARPKSADDCATDESFVCMDGRKYDASGNAVEPSVPFDCHCIPRQTDCDAACQTAPFGVYTKCVGDSPPSSSEPISCACATIGLK